jgi:ribonuclease P protein component
MKKSQSLGKDLRIFRERDWEDIKRNGQRLKLPHFLVIFKPNNNCKARLGISVGKKIPEAYKRNRLKRLIKECFRTNRERFSKGKGIDCIVIVSPKINGVKKSFWGELVREELLAAWEKIF